MESFIGTKNFKTVLVSFSSIKNFKSHKKVMESFFDTKNFKTLMVSFSSIKNLT